MSEIMKQQKLVLREIVIAFSGAAVVLLLTAFEQLGPGGSRAINKEPIPITGWYGAWLILQLAGLLLALLLVTARDWRSVPFSDKSGLFFSFLSVAWFCLLALDLRLISLSAVHWHVIIIFLGSLLMTAVLISRLRQKQQGDVFP